MKKILLIAGILLSVISHAQEGIYVDYGVTLEMVDGTEIKGWNRTKFMNKIKFIEISETPDGKRIRYDNDQVLRVVFDDGTIFVKKDICTNIKKDKTTPDSWVRVDYTGKGIALYSAYSEGWEQVNNHRRKVSQRTYFIALHNDNPVWAATNFLSAGTANRAGFNRSMLRYYFSKRYPQYAEFAKRIKAKEFDVKETPMEVIKAWEEEYGNQ